MFSSKAGDCLFSLKNKTPADHLHANQIQTYYKHPHSFLGRGREIHKEIVLQYMFNLTMCWAGQAL